MENSNYTPRIIKPAAGYYLTQKGNVDIMDRIITPSEIWLGVNDSEDNYIEIDADMAQYYRNQQKMASLNEND